MNKMEKEPIDYIREFTVKLKTNYLKEWYNEESSTLEEHLTKINVALSNFLGNLQNILEIGSPFLMETLDPIQQRGELLKDISEISRLIYLLKRLGTDNTARIVKLIEEASRIYIHLYELINIARTESVTNNFLKGHASYVDSIFNEIDKTIRDLNKVLIEKASSQ